MRFKLLFAAIFLSPIVVFSQKKTNKNILQMADGIYLVTIHGTTGYSAKARLRRKALDEANEFASQNESTVEVVSLDEIPVKIGSVPRVDLKFKLIKNSVNGENKINSNVNNANIQRTDDQIILKRRNQDEKGKIEKLERLGKLYKDGILSKEEFESEKKKILSENY